MGGKHLFLFGGSPPFTKGMAKQFADMVLARGSYVAVLVVEREGWEQYMPRYIQALVGLGVSEFRNLPLPSVRVEQATEVIRGSAGVVIGGGDTNQYADYIVGTAISDAIKERYEAGVPVAGFSAGALLSTEACVISAKDNMEEEFQHRLGLGLLSDVVVAVHFSEWGDEAHLREAFEKFGDRYSYYGIDENTGMYFRNGQLGDVEGKGVCALEGDRLQRIARVPGTNAT
ncbi:MAG TPA: Type 1 glutamine amidotransferase-like domain-containing protein [Bacillaceae bacterium]